MVKIYLPSSFALSILSFTMIFTDFTNEGKSPTVISTLVPGFASDATVRIPDLFVIAYGRFGFSLVNERSFSTTFQ